MGTVRKQAKRNRRPDRTPEERENRLISLATDLAEKQLEEGTASAQVITHFLKLGSTKEKLEQQMMATQMRNIEAKTDVIQTAKRVEDMYKEALMAMSLYSGESNGEDED